MLWSLSTLSSVGEYVGVGATRPHFAEVRCGSDIRSIVLKVASGTNRVTEEQLVNEIVGLTVASCLGLAIPQPHTVIIDDARRALLEAMGHPGSAGWAIGGQKVTGMHELVGSAPGVRDLHQDATSVLFADFLLVNTDRTPVNPNLAIHQGKLLIFDFGAALARVNSECIREPMRLYSETGLDRVIRHITRQWASSELEPQRVTQALEQSRLEIQALRDQPREGLRWTPEAEDRAELLIKFLSAIIPNVDRIIERFNDLRNSLEK